MSTGTNPSPLQAKGSSKEDPLELLDSSSEDNGGDSDSDSSIELLAVVRPRPSSAAASSCARRPDNVSSCARRPDNVASGILPSQVPSAAVAQQGMKNVKKRRFLHHAWSAQDTVVDICDSDSDSASRPVQENNRKKPSQLEFRDIRQQNRSGQHRMDHGVSGHERTDMPTAIECDLEDSAGIASVADDKETADSPMENSDASLENRPFESQSEIDKAEAAGPDGSGHGNTTVVERSTRSAVSTEHRGDCNPAKNRMFDDDSDSVSSKDAGEGGESSEEEYDGALWDKKETSGSNRRSPQLDEPKLSSQSQRLHPLHPLRKYDEIFEGHPERENTRVKVRDLAPEGNELHPPELNVVRHLSKEYLDANGLPVKVVVVYGGGDDSILYKIRIDVRRSEFEGAGYGAFFTYLGALKLKDDAQKQRGARMIAASRPYTPDTAKLLSVTDVDGQVRSLRVTGEHLHGNGNALYWPQCKIPLMAKLKERKIPISLEGNGLEYQDEIDEGDRSIAKAKLDEMQTRGLLPVGYLGIHSIEDYVDDPTIPLDMTGNSLQIGIYGPFRRLDRKTMSHFDIKNFLFSNRPSMYPFEVEEELENEIQIIDVTDDVTGRPHKAAREKIPMYVNEVGYDLKNKQTVFGHGSESGHGVVYNVVLCDGMVMNKGNCFELLCNYFQSYEPNREMEGYGLKNLYHGLASSIARIVRNGVEERAFVLDDLQSLKPLKISDGLERVTEITLNPINEIIRAFVISGDTSAVSSLQLVASRRAAWLEYKCRPVLREWEQKLLPDYTDCRHNAGIFSIRQAERSLASWGCQDYLFGQAKTDNRVLGDDAKTISEVLRMEAREDVCFELNEQILDPFDESVWCKIGRDLCEQICDIVHFSDCPPWCEAEDFQSRLIMTSKCVSAVGHAAARMKLAIRESTVDISFTSGLTEDHVIHGGAVEIASACKTSNAFYLDCGTTPKAFSAEIARRLSLLDAISSGGEVAQRSSRPLYYKDTFVMTETSQLKGEHAHLSKIASIPSNATADKTINLEWYMLWQVAYPACVFLRRYLPSHFELLLPQICGLTGLQRHWIEFALQRGMQEKPDKLEDVCLPKKDIQYEWVSALVQHTVAAKQRSGVAKVRAKTSKAHREKIRSPKKAKTLPLGGVHFPPGGKGGLRWEGPPTEREFRGTKEPITWSPGWKKQICERANGKTKGDFDSYWVSPLGMKLRSMSEVKRFFDCLAACANDEKAAMRTFCKSR